MEQHPFIFSNRIKYRLRRHFSYWVFWWLFQSILYSFIYIGNRRFDFGSVLLYSIMASLVFMLVHIFLSYSLIYFVLPRYLLKQKYWLTAGWVVSLFFLAAGMSTAMAVLVIPLLRYSITGFYNPQSLTIDNIALGMMAGLRGAITIGGISATIKLMKYWYTKERKNLQLQKENAESQLQLLKAQVHPHFLFNTLNNIYSFTQNSTSAGSRLVMGLSDMLRYMLYECNQPLVPLDKELKMLRDYTMLEQVRYDNGLDIHINLPDNTQGLYIAPLLLLPFVENSFKHGASNIVDQPWISLHISLEGDTMKMNLVNGKPTTVPSNTLPGNAGIGIVNARKRLSLLYPDNHVLEILNDEEVFIVNLRIGLERKTPLPEKPFKKTVAELYA